MADHARPVTLGDLARKGRLLWCFCLSCQHERAVDPMALGLDLTETVPGSLEAAQVFAVRVTGNRDAAAVASRSLSRCCGRRSVRTAGRRSTTARPKADVFSTHLFSFRRRSGSNRKREQLGAMVTSAPVLSSSAIWRRPARSKTPTAAGLGYSARICTTLGPSPPVAARNGAEIESVGQHDAPVSLGQSQHLKRPVRRLRQRATNGRPHVHPRSTGRTSGVRGSCPEAISFTSQ